MIIFGFAFKWAINLVNGRTFYFGILWAVRFGHDAPLAGIVNLQTVISKTRTQEPGIDTH